MKSWCTGRKRRPENKSIRPNMRTGAPEGRWEGGIQKPQNKGQECLHRKDTPNTPKESKDHCIAVRFETSGPKEIS